MKKKYIFISDTVFNIVSYIFNYSIVKYYRYSVNKIHSYSVKRKFKECGKNFHIEMPSYLLGFENIEIGNNFCCFERLRLETYTEHNGVRFTPKIRIGNNVSINYDCHIGAMNEIIIKDNVLIASKVFITDHFHGRIHKDELDIPPNKRILYTKGRVVIEENVWIGEGVVIMPNVTIGKNAIIGANSVITKDVPENSVVGGNPVRIIKILK